MIDFVSVLLLENHLIRQDEDNPLGLLLDEELSKTLKNLNYTIDQDSDSSTSNHVTTLRPNALCDRNMKVRYYEKNGETFLHFLDSKITTEDFLELSGFEVIRYETVKPSHFDINVINARYSRNLEYWLLLFHNKKSPRIYILGIDDFGVVCEDMQIPDESILGKPADETDYKEWLDNANERGVLSNFF